MGNVRRKLKELYEDREAIRTQMTALCVEHNARLEAALKPLGDQAADLDIAMSRLLGQDWSWIEGKFDADGLPLLCRE
jgi:hypothetical protein